MIQEQQKPKQEKPWYSKHPFLVIGFVLTMIIVFYMLFLYQYPPKHPITTLRNSLGQSLIIIIVISIGGIIAWLSYKHFGKMREFHPVPKIKENCRQYLYEEHGEIADPTSMQVDELVKGSSTFLVNNPHSHRILIYDPNTPKPHIRGDILDDAYLYKKQVFKEKYFDIFAKKQLEESNKPVILP